ncbi:OmpH family outer membrane protein [Candidatus Pseudothioglobus sp. Uisw_050_01]|uniref:OmpH family outer membrane protein n=1 Tax=Candidatus Pseudothioglobus sp. Uisw_050_01 TaxID=3230997 RepID=UPI003A8B158C
MRNIAISCLVLLSISAFSETIKIGYIDTEQVVNNLPQYQQSVLEISKEFEPKKQELLNLFKHIELLREKVNAINNTEKKENLQIELSKLTLLEESFKKETEYWQETMNTKKIKLLQKIELLINNTINDLAISESYDLILYENAAFVSDEVNISNKVIQRIQNNSL